LNLLEVFVMKNAPKNQKLFLLLPILLVLIFGIIYFRNANAPTPANRGAASPSARTAPPAQSRESSLPPAASNVSQPASISPQADKIPDSAAAAQPNRNVSTKAPAPVAPYQISNPRPLTAKEDFMHPRWSPDGLDVLFTRGKFQGLYIVSADGSQIRELSKEDGIGFNTRWSKDGSKLIVDKDGVKKAIDLAGGEDSVEAIEESADPAFAKNDNIYIKNPATGESEAITNGEDSFFAPQVSPDGEKVAYVGLTTGIHIKDISTGEVSNIGQGANIQWMPDGNGLIYNLSQDDGIKLISGDIYFAYADGSGVYNITNSPDVIELNPTISPDGKSISYEVDGQIFTADINEILPR